MGDTIQFVDAISLSPSIRLDLNEGTRWRVRAFDAPPPRLRRAMVSNAMTDGAYVSSSSYDSRVLTMVFDLITDSQDINAYEWQRLARELDRPTNIIRYQPEGMGRPVFFKTWRSDATQVTDMFAAVAYRQIEVEIVAEPFALGARETVSVGTVNMDPAAGSNGCYFDVSGILGDVAVPCAIQNTTAWRTYGMVSTRTDGLAGDMVWIKQAESCTLGTNTTNPGGGPDAAMSGTGTNNYVTTTFGTATLIPRVTWNLDTDITTRAQRVAMRGKYHVVGFVRRSAATSVLQAQAYLSFGSVIVTGTTVTLSTATTRMAVDFGVFDFSPITRALPNETNPSPADAWPTISLSASRTGGTDTLDWDCILLIPAIDTFLQWGIAEIQDTGLDQLIDGYNESIYVVSGSDPWDSSGVVTADRVPLGASGGYPRLLPGKTNRVFLLTGSSGFTIPVTDTEAITVYYWPGYLHVRPIAS